MLSQSTLLFNLANTTLGNAELKNIVVVVLILSCGKA